MARSVTLARRCVLEAPLWLQAVLPACLMLGLIISGVCSHVVDNLLEILSLWQRATIGTVFIFHQRGSWHAPWQCIYISVQQCNNSSSARLLEIDMADLSLISQAVMLLGPIYCVDAALKPCRLEMHLSGAVACQQSQHPPPPTPRCRSSKLCRHGNAYLHTSHDTFLSRSRRPLLCNIAACCWILTPCCTGI